jgi:hypothetical protein
MGSLERSSIVVYNITHRSKGLVLTPVQPRGTLSDVLEARKTYRRNDEASLDGGETSYEL